MKKIKIGMLLVALSLFSCSDYLDVNNTPNSPYEKDIPPHLLLPGAQSSIFRTQTLTMNALGNVWMNNWASNTNQVTGAFSREFSLQISSTFYSGIWDGLFRNLGNFQAIIDFPLENQENYVAIAKIMKAHYYQYIVDMYGDAPYSEAFKKQGNLTPKYDDDQAIYRALVVELDQAVAAIDAAAPNADAVGAQDIMFGGDMSKWKKFANTIKLRYLLRQAKKASVDGATMTYITQQLNTLATANFVDTDVTINPGYNATNDSRQNPFFNAYGSTSAGTVQTNRAAVIPTKYVADFLNGDPAVAKASGLVDPRRGRIFTLVGGKVVGSIQGATLTPASTSRFGVVLIPGTAGTPNVATGSVLDGYVMTLAESKFLQAEAAARFPGVFTGNAKTLFEDGVRASCTFNGVSAAAANTYITGANTRSGLGWDASASLDAKIDAIMTQKWIALINIHALESFITYTATGYPNTPLASTAGYPTKPKRLIYPQSEYVSNSANVPDVQLDQVFVQGPFWYVP
ncbi:SusD/RagB family nutrient-binding outer membrane lipoprotein [Flavobacterium sp. '19STA2R22 D10 B1']|uniref:SusD/RagB family nutrient-binding outer membrane lipoprotein n=1 Tax=Flavobacterium aerium TaxID=3037261 RepID=UPI00278C0505|nr:SusD/RagB family nutrient-binding outer membrane lipoprotein [Flavobacterium sp. '19STA2R22 D10 B1']